MMLNMMIGAMTAFQMILPMIPVAPTQCFSTTRMLPGISKLWQLALKPEGPPTATTLSWFMTVLHILLCEIGTVAWCLYGNQQSKPMALSK